MIRPIYDYVTAKVGKLPEDRFFVFLNAAVAELWTTLDPELDECMIQSSGPLITLPWFVANLRAIRRICSDEAMQLHTPRPYYASKNPDTEMFVVVQSSTPLQRSLSVASTFTIRRAIADKEVKVRINGSTRTGSSISFEVVMAKGELEKEMAHVFMSVSSIARNVPDSCDTEIYDAADILLTRIPSDRLEARYQKIRLTDRRYAASTDVEHFAIYYRPVVPVYQHLDTSLDSRLGTVIQNKTLEHVLIGSAIEADQTAAAIYGGKAKSALQNRNATEKLGTTVHINTGSAAHDYQYVPRPIRGC